jgi:hypothetical protein
MPTIRLLRPRLGPAMRNVFATFEDLCLLGLQFLQLEYVHKTFGLELIESVLMNYHEHLCKVCLSSLSNASQTRGQNQEASGKGSCTEGGGGKGAEPIPREDEDESDPEE